MNSRPRHRCVLVPRAETDRIAFLGTQDLANAHLSPRQLLRVRSIRMEKDRVEASIRMTLREIEKLKKEARLTVASAERTPNE